MAKARSMKQLVKSFFLGGMEVGKLENWTGKKKVLVSHQMITGGDCNIHGTLEFSCLLNLPLN